MSEELQQKLRAQLWEVANNLRGSERSREGIICSPARQYVSQRIYVLLVGLYLL